jgi:hypothetical protein
MVGFARLADKLPMGGQRGVDFRVAGHFGG